MGRLRCSSRTNPSRVDLLVVESLREGDDEVDIILVKRVGQSSDEIDVILVKRVGKCSKKIRHGVGSVSSVCRYSVSALAGIYSLVLD